MQAESRELTEPPTFALDGRRVGGGAPCLLIAEIGQAHEGSLGIAHSFVDSVADAGADAIKFQTHLAHAESTLDEPFRVAMSGQDKSRLEYWRRMEFTEEQWAGLASHAKERGLVFLSSAFSVPAVELLERIGVPAWKVGSGEVSSIDLLEAMAATGKPILLSSGMSTFAEIATAVRRCREAGSPVAVLQCTSRYPLPLEEVGLNVLAEYRTQFDCPVGLSDHSGSMWPGVAAMTLGSDLVEVHVVFDRRAYGPDADASITIDELAQMAAARDAIQIMRDSPVDKDAIAVDLAPMRDLFTKSIATTLDLDAGTRLESSMLTAKKPGTGIPVSELPRIVGRALVRDVSADRLLRWEDLSA